MKIELEVGKYYKWEYDGDNALHSKAWCIFKVLDEDFTTHPHHIFVKYLCGVGCHTGKEWMPTTAFTRDKIKEIQDWEITLEMMKI